MPGARDADVSRDPVLFSFECPFLLFTIYKYKIKNG